MAVGEKGYLFHLFKPAAAERIYFMDRIDHIPEKFQPDSAVEGKGRINFYHVTPHSETSPFELGV
jgi:hypothetical protein